jgi:hypothetical protein
MKTNCSQFRPKRFQAALSTVAALTVLSSAGPAVADDLNFATFDFGLSGIAWQSWRDYVTGHTMDWDALQDADGNPNSGSMYVTVNWPLSNNPAWTNACKDVQVAFGPTSFTASDYIEVEAYIKIDVANSFPALDGSYGVAGLYLNGSGGWQQVQGYAGLAANNTWQRVHGFLSAVPDGTYSEVVVGLISNGDSSPTNTIAYWIDNVRLTGPPSVNTNEPSLALAPPPPAGLTCIASAPDDAWQRQTIRTGFGTYGWHTTTAQANTTTYSMTLAAFPSAAHSGFEAMMYLIPDAGMPNGPDDPSVDWNSMHVAYFTITANADGTSKANFRYKVNDAGAEHFQTWRDLACPAGPLGKWSLAFNNNTNVTMTAPTGAELTFTIPTADADMFQGGVMAYFGVRPTATSRVGQSATFSRVQITGAAASIDDSFVGQGRPYTLNANTWIRKASHPAGIFITPPDALCWVSWPTPDSGFTNLYASDDLTKPLGASWKSLPSTATGWILVGGNKRLAVVDQFTLSTAFGYLPSKCFFGLWHE